MRSVKNVSRNGRTVMVTIHQPSIEIFEGFDALFLLQRGGRVSIPSYMLAQCTHRAAPSCLIMVTTWLVTIPFSHHLIYIHIYVSSCVIWGLLAGKAFSL